MRELRERAGLTQQQLADKLNVSRQSIISIEHDRYTPTLPLTFAIAALFGKPIEEIFFP